MKIDQAIENASQGSNDLQVSGMFELGYLPQDDSKFPLHRPIIPTEFQGYIRISAAWNFYSQYEFNPDSLMLPEFMFLSKKEQRKKLKQVNQIIEELNNGIDQKQKRSVFYIIPGKKRIYKFRCNQIDRIVNTFERCHQKLILCLKQRADITSIVHKDYITQHDKYNFITTNLHSSNIQSSFSGRSAFKEASVAFDGNIVDSLKNFNRVEQVLKLLSSRIQNAWRRRNCIEHIVTTVITEYVEMLVEKRVLTAPGWYYAPLRNGKYILFTLTASAEYGGRVQFVVNILGVNINKHMPPQSALPMYSMDDSNRYQDLNIYQKTDELFWYYLPESLVQRRK